MHAGSTHICSVSFTIIGLKPTCLIVYMFILYKPSGILYKLTGVMMTALILAGYGICIANIVYTGKSKCSYTAIGKMSKIDGVVFLIIASLLLTFSQLMVFFTWCTQKCGKKGAAPPQEAVVPEDVSVFGDGKDES